MCDPGTILGVAGLGAQVGGAFMKGTTDAENYVDKAKYSMLQADMYGETADAALGNLDLLRTQAAIAHGNVDIAQAKGRLDESRVTEAGHKTLVAQKLSFAYRNIDPTYGSPLVMQAKAAGDIETDIGLVRAGTAISVAQALTGEANVEQQGLGQANAAVTARGNAILSLTNAGMNLRNADNQGPATILSAGTSLLTGGAKIWNLAAKAGAGGTADG